MRSKSATHTLLVPSVWFTTWSQALCPRFLESLKNSVWYERSTCAVRSLQRYQLWMFVWWPTNISLAINVNCCPHHLLCSYRVCSCFPRASLAAIILTAVTGLFRYQEFMKLWRERNWGNMFTFLVCFFVTAFVGAVEGTKKTSFYTYFIITGERGQHDVSFIHVWPFVRRILNRVRVVDKPNLTV